MPPHNRGWARARGSPVVTGTRTLPRGRGRSVTHASTPAIQVPIIPSITTTTSSSSTHPSTPPAHHERLYRDRSPFSFPPYIITQDLPLLLKHKYHPIEPPVKAVSPPFHHPAYGQHDNRTHPLQQQQAPYNSKPTSLPQQQQPPPPTRRTTAVLHLRKQNLSTFGTRQAPPPLHPPHLPTSSCKATSLSGPSETNKPLRKCTLA